MVLAGAHDTIDELEFFFDLKNTPVKPMSTLSSPGWNNSDGVEGNDALSGCDTVVIDIITSACQHRSNEISAVLRSLDVQYAGEG